MSELEDTKINGVSIIDRLQILDEVNRYAWAWDSGDIEEYLNCYAVDGALEHPTKDGKPGYHVGRDAVREAIQANMDSRPTNAYGLQHHFGSPRLEPKGDDVVVNAYCAVLRHEFHPHLLAARRYVPDRNLALPVYPHARRLAHQGVVGEDVDRHGLQLRRRDPGP